MTVQIDNNKDLDLGVGKAAPYYRTRVKQAIELLEEAARFDAAYQGDMLAEGVREGVMNCALAILRKLDSISCYGRSKEWRQV